MGREKERERVKEREGGGRERDEERLREKRAMRDLLTAQK